MKKLILYFYLIKEKLYIVVIIIILSNLIVGRCREIKKTYQKNSSQTFIFPMRWDKRTIFQNSSVPIGYGR